MQFKLNMYCNRPTLIFQHYVLQGWPQTTLVDDYKSFVNRKSELSVIDECILWDIHVS